MDSAISALLRPAAGTAVAVAVHIPRAEILSRWPGERTDIVRTVFDRFEQSF
jgi:hypothetical protein